MFTEYVSASDNLDADQLMSIFGDLNGTPSLWTETQYVETLEAAGLDIHVNEELSDQYVGFINGAWAEFQSIVDNIKSSDETDLEKASLLKMIGISAELWTHLAMALGTGEIQLRRFLARKK